jgi:two-component system sensor kinase FixL
MFESEDSEGTENYGFVAFICDADSRIESVASLPALSARLSEGTRLLDSLAGAGCGLLFQKWSEMLQTQREFAVNVTVAMTDDEAPALRVLHVIPLHGGTNGQQFLATMTLTTGFEPIRSGPDEIARCRAVLDTAVDAVVTIDTRGIVQNVNPATLKMFGFAEQELIGHNVSVLMPEPFRSEHDGYLQSYQRTGKASIIGIGRQVIGRKQTGEEFPVHLGVSEYTVGGKRFFTGIIRDLTELEQVQRQLLQAERLAAIGQMVTGLAHESRNALQRAQACLDMLSLDLEEHPEQFDLARRAKTALQDLHRLYEEVRSYAAPIHLEFRECDLSTIWRKEWDNLSAFRRDKLIRLVEAEEHHPRCEVDVHRMEQVFRNILENSVHACGDEGNVTIRCEQISMSGKPVVRIRIQDDGVGITPQVAQQMFEPFFTTKQKGTGLGMAIVHRIMTAHGGTISAHSLSPRGVEIELLIPVRTSVRNAVRN